MLTDLVTALQIARDPTTPLPELTRLVGLDDEIDRALAEHPAASGALLESLASRGDDLVRRLVARHSACPMNLCRRLGKQYPGELLRNPALAQFLARAPLFLRGLDVLESVNCPEFWLRWAAEYGTTSEMLAVARNPIDALSRLACHRLRQRQGAAWARILRIANQLTDPQLLHAVQTLFDQARGVFIARRQVRSPDDPQYRMSDQVQFGFPYTSAAWPWPEASEGIMYGIAQINLGHASRLLGCDLGTGLYQCWLTPGGETMDRIIPEDSLALPATPVPAGYAPAAPSSRISVASAREARSRRASPPARPWVTWAEAGQSLPCHPAEVLDNIDGAAMGAVEHPACSDVKQSLQAMPQDLLALEPVRLGGHVPYWDPIGCEIAEDFRRQTAGGCAGLLLHLGPVETLPSWKSITVMFGATSDGDRVIRSASSDYAWLCDEEPNAS